MEIQKQNPIVDHQKWVRKKTSEVMLELADLPGNDGISLVQMLRYMRGRAFGMIMVLLAILSLIPNLFGHAILTGLLLATLSLQMVLGFTHIWLPRRVLRLSFSRAGLKKVMNVIAPKIARIEKLLKPRLIFLTEDIGRRIIGLIMLPLSLLVMVPFPLSNFWPAMAMLVLSLGLIEKDGVVVIFGMTMAMGAIVIVREVMQGVF